MSDSFGTQLKACRESVGMSQAELARRINYSKSQLSKVENDLKPPNPTLARLCDAVLKTDGRLAGLVQAGSPEPVAESAADDEAWTMEFEEFRFQGMPRRQVLVGGAALALTARHRPAADPSVLTALRLTFDQHRALGMMTRPGLVLAPVIANAWALRVLADDSPEPVRSQALLLASRAAEYAGWMCQEAGRNQDAIQWTERAVLLAENARDSRMASYASFRKAEIALYRQDALGTIELARQAQRDPGIGPRILGQAARCEAQGHALNGDRSAFERLMDRAGTLLEQNDQDTAAPVLGSSVADQVSLARGWGLCDLGWPAESAELLDGRLPTIPANARRVRARFGVRRALAHAHSGEIDQACGAVHEVLDDVTLVASATIRLDLRELSRTLSRYRSHTPVRELSPRLTKLLCTPAR